MLLADLHLIFSVYHDKACEKLISPSAMFMHYSCDIDDSNHCNIIIMNLSEVLHTSEVLHNSIMSHLVLFDVIYRKYHYHK